MIKLVLSILFEPLLSFIRALWLDRGDSQVACIPEIKSLYRGFIKVPMLWRIHMILRLVKFVCLMGTLDRPKPSMVSASTLSKWYAAVVLQSIHVVLFLLDWIPGRIFRTEVFMPNPRERIRQLWLIYFAACAFQIPSTVAVTAIIPDYWFGILQCIVAAFNLFYCARMKRLRPQFQRLSPRIQGIEGRYEPTVERGQTGDSVSLQEMYAEVPNGPLAVAFRDQQRKRNQASVPVSGSSEATNPDRHVPERQVSLQFQPFNSAKLDLEHGPRGDSRAWQ
jgi:hypothetical protein